MIEIIKVQEDEKIPATNVNTEDNNLPKKCVMLEGGGKEPVLKSITITENGNTIPPEGVDGYNDITVLVPTPTLEAITITENGTTTAPSGKAYNEVTVAIPEKEPESVVLAFSNYATAEADSITGYKEFTGNCTYQASEGFVNMIYNDNRGQYRHNWLCNQTEKYNFEYEIELGSVDRGERNSNNYLFSFYKNQNTTGGAECELYWDYTNSVWKLHHSSGSSTVTEIPAQSDIFANSITKLYIEMAYQTGSSTKKGFIYIQNENINNGDILLLHDIGGDWGSRYLCIGNKGNNDGFYNIEIKSVKLTRKINHNFDPV